VGVEERGVGKSELLELPLGTEAIGCGTKGTKTGEADADADADVEAEAGVGACGVDAVDDEMDENGGSSSR
jgi:hypothetical protein